MKQVQTQKQSGFTLIELIVVMVILGILAATALPRFINLGGDARAASMNAARGSLNSTIAMIHGRWLAAGGLPGNTSINADGVTVTVDAAGWPTAHANLWQAAGLDGNDYTQVGVSNSTATSGPTTSATQIAIIPRTVNGTARAATCGIIYTAAVITNGAVTTPHNVSDAPDGDEC